MPVRTFENTLRRTFSSLRTRNFRLFFFGQLISNSGNWLTNVAITLLVLHRTGSGSAVGLLAVCQYGPMLVFSAWAGLVADRSNKRHLLYVTQSLEMAESFALALLAFLPRSPLPAFYAVALVGGCLLAFDNPARRSFVSEMVPPEQLTNAVSLYSAMVNLSRIAGPAIAGALIVSVGYGWCFAIDGASYLIVLYALVRMRPGELRRPVAVPRGRGQLRAGVRYIARVPELRVSFAMLLIVGVASYNFNVVFPLFVVKGLGGSDAAYTALYAIFSAGAVVGTLVIARRATVRLRRLIAACAVFGATMLALAAVPDMALAYPVAAAVGGTSVVYMTATTALGQLRADAQMVGRVVALQTVLQIGTTPVGGPVLGWVADVAGGRVPVIIGGVAALAASLLGAAIGRHHLGRPGASAPPGNTSEVLPEEAMATRS